MRHLNLSTLLTALAVTLLSAAPLPACTDDDAAAWQQHLGNGSPGPIAIGPDGTVYVGARGAFSAAGWLRAYSKSGKLKWEREGGNPIIGADGLLYAVSDPLLYAIEPDSGDIRWFAEAGGQIAIRRDGWVFSAWRSQAQIFLGQSTLAGVAPTGQVMWEHVIFGAVWEAPLITRNGTVLFLKEDGAGLHALLAYDRDGVHRWSVDLPERPLGAAIRKDGRIIVTGVGFVASIPDDDTTGGWWSPVVAPDTGEPYEIGPPVIAKDGHIYSATGIGTISIAISDTEGATPRWIHPRINGPLAAGDDGRIYVSSGSVMAVMRSSGELDSVTDMYSLTHVTGPPALAHGRAYVAGHFFHNQTFYGPGDELLGAEIAYDGFIYSLPVKASGLAKTGWARIPGGDNGNTRSAAVRSADLGPAPPPRGVEAEFGQWRSGFGVPVGMFQGAQLPDGGRVFVGGGSVIARTPFDIEASTWVRRPTDRAASWLAILGPDGATRRMTALDIEGTETTTGGYQDPDTSMAERIAVLSDGTIVAVGAISADGSDRQFDVVAYNQGLEPLWTLDLPDRAGPFRPETVRHTDDGTLVLVGRTYAPDDFRGVTSVVRVADMSAAGAGAAREVDVSGDAWLRVDTSAVSGSGAVMLQGELSGPSVLLGHAMAPQTAGVSDSVIIQLSPDDEVSWVAQYPGPLAVVAVDAGPAGEWTLGGTIYSPLNFGHGVLDIDDQATAYAGWVLRLSPEGVAEWSHKVGAEVAAGVSGVSADPYGNVTIAGNFGSDFEIGGRRFVTRGDGVVAIQLNADGQALWGASSYGGRLSGPTVETDAAGDLTLVGPVAPIVGFGLGAVDMRFRAHIAASAGAPFFGYGVVRLSGAGARAGELMIEPSPDPVGERVTVDVDGPGRVVSAPAGIDCPGTCEANFASLSEVTLTATGDGGGHLVRWSGEGCEAGQTCVFTARGPTNIEADFAAPAVPWIRPLEVAGTPWAVAGTDAGYVVLHGLDMGEAYALPDASFTATRDDSALLGYDNDGTLSWSRTLNATAKLWNGTVAAAGDGGFVYAAVVSLTSPVDLGDGPLAPITASDLVVARYASDGSAVWTRRFGVAVSRSGQLVLSVAPDGHIAVGGYEMRGGEFASTTFPIEPAAWLAVLDGAGEAQWLRRTPGGDPTDLAALPGGAVVAGFARPGVDLGRGLELQNQASILARYDATGALLHVGSIDIGGSTYRGPQLSAIGADVVFVIHTGGYGTAPDGTSLHNRSGIIGRWQADGSFSDIADIVPSGGIVPTDVLVGSDGVFVAGDARGPNDNPTGQEPRYNGPSLTSWTADGTEGWFLPTFARDAPSVPVLPARGLFQFADGDVGIVLTIREVTVFAGRALALGHHVVRVTP